MFTLRFRNFHKRFQREAIMGSHRQDAASEKKLFDQIASKGERERIPNAIYETIYFELNLLKEDGTSAWPGASLLEFGCNDGLHALNLARAGYQTAGVDISAEAVKIAQ